MANHTYVPSNCIYIFPCAKRAYNNSAASKFLTQYNLTHLTGGGKSYNLTKEDDTYMRFSIMGYFVQIDYTSQQGKTWWENFLTAAKPGTGHVLYAYINLASEPQSAFADRGDVNKQPRLTSIAPNTELDQQQSGTPVFTALQLAFMNSEEQANSTITMPKVKLATVTAPNTLQWQVYSEVLKFAEGSENNGITIQLSQSVSTQEISAKATKVDIGTEQLVNKAVTYDKMKIDTEAYGVTAGVTSTGRLQAQLVNNSGSLKIQLLGLIQADDIANNAVTTPKLRQNAVTYDKLNVNTSAGRDTAAQEQLGARVLQDGSTGNLKAQLVGKVQTGDIAPNAVTKTELHSDIQDIVDHPGQLKITTSTGTEWYPISLSADEKTLYIGDPPATQ